MQSAPITIGRKTYVLESDDHYLRDLGDRFEPDMVRLFDCLLRRDFCVVDVGANIGCTSILFGDLTERVLSFEPSPSTFRILQRNVERSGLRNIELYNHALGAHKTQTRLTFSIDNRAGAFVSGKMKTSAGHVTEVIQVERLDDVVRRLELPRLDFIKIDTEGYEKSVIAGARDVMRRDEPVVVLEMNHWCLNVLQRVCLPDFLDDLRSIFPVLYALDGERYLDLRDEAESYIVMYHHVNHGKYRNLLAAFDRERLGDFHSRFAHTT